MSSAGSSECLKISQIRRGRLGLRTWGACIWHSKMTLLTACSSTLRWYDPNTCSVPTPHNKITPKLSKPRRFAQKLAFFLLLMKPSWFEVQRFGLPSPDTPKGRMGCIAEGQLRGGSALNIRAPFLLAVLFIRGFTRHANSNATNLKVRLGNSTLGAGSGALL